MKPCLPYPAKAVSGGNTIMYLCYGSGPHVEETVFSLLTAFKHLPPDTPGYRYVIYTDKEEAFKDLPVEVRPVLSSELNCWMGGAGYIHRRKAMALLDALERFGGKVAFVDCDTYFRRSPKLLFSRIKQGRSVLHVLEAGLRQSGTDIDAKLDRVLTAGVTLNSSGKMLRFPSNSPMWNSGVIGIAAADRSLLHDLPDLIDRLWEMAGVHHVEQFAVGHLLGVNKIEECRDVVFHYWADYLRKPFRARLPHLLHEYRNLSLDEKAAQAFRDRPQPSLIRWSKIRLRAVLRRLGLPISGMMKSA